MRHTCVMVLLAALAAVTAVLADDAYLDALGCAMPTYSQDDESSVLLVAWRSEVEADDPMPAGWS